MPTLLIAHHTPSPALQAMFEAVADGAGTDEIEGVEVVVRPALTASAVDVLAADGYLLGTPVHSVLGTVRPYSGNSNSLRDADVQARLTLRDHDIERLDRLTTGIDRRSYRRQALLPI